MNIESINPNLLYGVLAIILTFLSGLIPLVHKWHEDHLHGFVSFSAGILMGTAFIHLLPDTIERLPSTEVGFWILGSFIALFILEKFIMLHPCEESHCDYHTIGITAFIGMTIHTFMDGLALGSAFFVEGLGSVVFFAIMAHKIPSSFTLASILKKAKWSNKKIMLFIFFFSLVIPLGALSSGFILKHVGQDSIGKALALSLGTFFYIATSDFLPEVHRAHANKIKHLIYFLIGTSIIAADSLLLGH